MALPFPTTYFIGIGTAISNLGVPTELSGGSYARLACAFTGSAIAGLTQTVGPWVVATAPTPAVNCYYGLMFDALTGGNLIAYWNWNPGTNGTYTGSLTAFPQTVVNISFANNVGIALNMALTGGPGTSGSILDQGAQIGWVNGNAMLAGVRLNIATGGSLTAHLGQGAFLTSEDVEDSLYSNSFGSGNILTSITALSGGANSAATPVLTGFFNRIGVCAGSGDSVILPSTILSPGGVGSFLMVNNAGASLSQCFPDTGASINGASANAALTLGTLSSAILFRTGPLTWVSVPKVPS